MHHKNQPIVVTQKGSHATFYLLLIIGISLFFHVICMALADLLVEEAYYWNYAQHLDFSYLDHPPMVALLIKLSTTILGTNEFSVRITSLICWVLTAFFSYRMTQLINRDAGLYAVMLLAILPFFFFQSLVITPDIPLILCWSASLYCLYRALILNQSNYWYAAGLSLGLGMLSKYTISLLGVATLFYLITVPSMRHWFRRKEPYICALIAALIWTPVIYWNATHEWVSFLFQSKRRFSATSSIDLPYLIALLFFFITPVGAFGLWELLKKNNKNLVQINVDLKRFMQVFTLAPLGFFVLFSLNHEINLNWIGPLFLALIPWLAVLIAGIPTRRVVWLRTAVILLACYSVILLIAIFNTSEQVQQKIFIKAVAWESLIKKFHDVAEKIEAKTKNPLIFVPLDNFPIGSELSFYQAKLLAQGKISKAYPIVGSHIFGVDSLMYRYWSKDEAIAGATLILISKESWRFLLPELTKRVNEQSELKSIYSTGQGQKVKNIPFYYKVAQVKMPLAIMEHLE